MGCLPIEMLYADGGPGSRGPEEIAGFQRSIELTAMRVAPKSTSGPISYIGEEGPITIVPICPRELQDGNGKSFRWWRFEVYSEPRDCPIGHGDTLVVAETPYARTITHSAPFKKCFVNNRPDPSTEIFDTDVAAKSWVAGLKREYFCSDKKFVVAAVSDPGGMLDPTQARNYPLNQSRLVLGVCEDLREYEKALLNSDAVQALLAQTERPMKLGPKAKYPHPIRLSRETIDECQSLMWAAVRQALAGPDDDSDAWTDRPVFDKLNEFFRNLVFNAWRRYESEQRHLAEAQDRDL